MFNKQVVLQINKIILQKQNNKCANSNKNYYCLLWRYNNGFFDESGYKFNYNYFNHTYSEALCPNCYNYKINNDDSLMDISD
jgi:hypothetical protein